MKETAWFQVLILVGVVVAIVLCISPIAKSIENANANKDRVKYYENNRISYDEVTSKIDKLDGGGEEFAVLFLSSKNETTTADDQQKEINYFEANTVGAVKIYVLNMNVCETNKSSWNADEKWYNYYKVSNPQMTDLRNASKSIYEDYWMVKAVSSNPNEVTQSSTYQDPTAGDASSLLSANTLIWFRASENIDDKIRNDSTITTQTKGEEYNFHVAKVYLTFQDSSASSGAQYVQGLQKFFNLYSA